MAANKIHAEIRLPCEMPVAIFISSLETETNFSDKSERKMLVAINPMIYGILAFECAASHLNVVFFTV